MMRFELVVRAKNGAEQSRLRIALERARARNVSLAEAGSRVGDIDVAREVTRLGRTDIQMDATRSVMVQAKMLGNLALKLLDVWHPAAPGPTGGKEEGIGAAPGARLFPDIYKAVKIGSIPCGWGGL